MSKAPPKKKRPKNLGPINPKKPGTDVTARRRENVERMWVSGMNIADIQRELEALPGGEKWSRPTLVKDLDLIRARWEEEGSKRSRSNVRSELERMARLVFSEAVKRKKVAVRRESNAEGKVVTTTVLLPDPDLHAANKAVERIAALHGLNITTLDGSLQVHTLTDWLGGLVAGESAKDLEPI